MLQAEGWHDLVKFLQELCGLARHTQPSSRAELLAQLVSLGLFEVKPCASGPEGPRFTCMVKCQLSPLLSCGFLCPTDKLLKPAVSPYLMSPAATLAIEWLQPSVCCTTWCQLLGLHLCCQTISACVCSETFLDGQEFSHQGCIAAVIAAP